MSNFDPPSDSLLDSSRPRPKQSPNRLSQLGQHRYLKFGGLMLGAIALALILNQIRPVMILQPVQDAVFWMEERYTQWYEQQALASGLTLLIAAFLGGLIASISPCILALLPVNLSYIGTRDITSRREASSKAIAFVLGVVTVLSILGLVSSAASFVMLRMQGYVYLAVGAVMIWMGLNLLGWVPLPLPKTQARIPVPGAYGVGLTFALVTSPCASPFLFSILGVAATSGSPLQSTLTMVSYALGYTAILFAASLLTGFATQARSLLPYSQRLVFLGAMVLVVSGLYYSISGLRWIEGMHEFLSSYLGAGLLLMQI